MSDAESSTASPPEPEAAPRSARRTRRLAVIGVVVAALVIGAAVVGGRSTGARAGGIVTFPPGYPANPTSSSLTLACVWGQVPGTLSLSMDNPAVDFTVWWVNFESRVQSIKSVTANMKNYSVPSGGTALYVGQDFTKPSTFYVTWTDQSSYYDTVTCT